MSNIEITKTIFNNSLKVEKEYLLSNENINKVGNRVKVKIDDIRHRTFTNSIKATSLMLEGEDDRETFIYDCTKKYNDMLRANDLLVESKKNKSQTRHAIDMEFIKFQRKLINLGLAFEHPTKPRTIVYEELTKGSGDNTSEELKPSYKSFSLNCNFVDFVDDVVKLEKVIKS